MRHTIFSLVVLSFVICVNCALENSATAANTGETVSLGKARENILQAATTKSVSGSSTLRKPEHNPKQPLGNPPPRYKLTDAPTSERIEEKRPAVGSGDVSGFVSKMKPIFIKGSSTKPEEKDNSNKPKVVKQPDELGNWENIARSIVSELKEAGLNIDTCLPGLMVEMENDKRILTLVGGKLAGFSTFQHTNDVKTVGETPGVIEFQMNFVFKNLRIEYDYEYIPNSMQKHKIKRGPLVLELQGDSLISITAAVYKFALASTSQADQCPFGITNMQIAKLGITMKTVKVNSSFFTRKFYVFMKLISPTVRGVTAIVESIQEYIKKDVSGGLEEVVGKAVQGLKKVCAMEQNWKPRDCNVITNLGIWY